MDDTLDPDVGARALALEAAMWFYDATGATPESIGHVVNLAEIFTHYLSDGQANEFNCTDKLRPTVRGGI